jgi:thiol-disulfide isomerase/thioredoxin
MNTMTTNIHPRRAFLGTAAGLLAGWPAGSGIAQGLLPAFGSRQQMPELAGALAWLNSRPLRRQELQGKVVLVQFGTFTCVNWQRTLPYVNAWSAKYGDAGLVTIGVHTPEFSFEGDVENVRAAIARLQLPFPIAVDSHRAIWNAFRNGAWPALYLFDATGTVRHRHDGEGEYERSEKWIQRLLPDAGAKNVPAGLVRVEGRGAQAPADWARLRSPETYTGHQKAERFRSPGGIVADRKRRYELPAHLADNTWAGAGEWTFGSEAARSEGPGARIACRFHARDVNLVMGALRSERPLPFRVRIDGQPPGPAHGSDTDPAGRGVMAERRLYQLVRQTGPIGSRLFEIEFLDAGAEVYAFTFG